MNEQALLPTGNSTRKCRLLLGFLLLAHAPSTAHGQQLVAGDTIRIRASQSTDPDPQWTDATVARLTLDTLWYRSNDIVSPISIDDAEIRRPTHRDHRWRGLAIGALTGVAVGGLAAYASYEPRFCSSSFFLSSCSGQANSRAGDTVLGAVTGSQYGAGLGFLVGMLLGRWETVELHQITVGAGNLAVSMRIRR